MELPQKGHFYYGAGPAKLLRPGAKPQLDLHQHRQGPQVHREPASLQQTKRRKLIFGQWTQSIIFPGIPGLAH